jgi:hypothetical protein
MHRIISLFEFPCGSGLATADFNRANRQSYLPIVPFFINGGKMMEMMDNNVA